MIRNKIDLKNILLYYIKDMTESTTKQNYKTPSYVRKASNNYYNKMKEDPEKYKAYLEKRRMYQRKKKAEKEKKDLEEKERLKKLQQSTEIFPHYSENYNPSDDNSSCDDN
jgi:hypothetical protein